MSLQDDIEDDLERKLQDDMRRAMVHFAEMCKLADVPNSHAWAAVIATLARGAIELAQQTGMPKDVFIESIEHQWDRCAKRKDALARGSRHQGA